ncbi:MAG: diaminopimelate decarboxylase [Ekhidna sp.]|nr:diaminopimelate decarboxylase [Ekhidna sp.]
MKNLVLNANKWQIQGIDLTDLKQKFGSPLYIYDSEEIKNQIEVFKKGFLQSDLKIKYACKALTNLNILRVMLQNGLGLDTVSLQEIKMGLSVGFKPTDIVFTPNCVSFDEISAGVKMGVRINIENISNLKKFAVKYGISVPVCIRLNPNISSQENSDKVTWWHNQSKFGISIDQIEEVEKMVRDKLLRVNGIHIHSSSVIMSTEVFMSAAKTVFNIARRFPGLEFIDFGGGIKPDVGDGNEVIDVTDLGKSLDREFKAFCNEYGKRLEIWFEPGRYLVGNAGLLLTTCVVRKRNGGTEFVGVDSGLNHLIRPMFYGAYHDVANISNPRGERKKYTVVGNVCEIDNLAKDRAIEEVREGDLIIFKSAGAYGYSMASTYNSRFRPAEVLIHKNEAKLIRRADSYDDLIRNQVEVVL